MIRGEGMPTTQPENEPKNFNDAFGRFRHYSNILSLYQLQHEVQEEMLRLFGPGNGLILLSEPAPDRFRVPVLFSNHSEKNISLSADEISEISSADHLVKIHSKDLRHKLFPESENLLYCHALKNDPVQPALFYFLSSDSEIPESTAAEMVSYLQNLSVLFHKAVEFEAGQRLLISFIENLSLVLDSRDYITAGHSQRVTLYALELGRVMRLRRTEMESLRLAALLHDVGKIAIPEAILYKTKDLNQDEYEIVKRHAQMTGEILSKAHFYGYLRDVPVIAAAHHERADGTGYPRGLKAAQIPLGSQIIAVADVFDALTSRRNRQNRQPIENVLELLDRETGAAFEPYVVYQFKHIRLDSLVQILEFGHGDELRPDDLKLLRSMMLKDYIESRKNKNSGVEFEAVDQIFNFYYQRMYRMPGMRR